MESQLQDDFLDCDAAMRELDEISAELQRQSEELDADLKTLEKACAAYDKIKPLEEKLKSDPANTELKKEIEARSKKVEKMLEKIKPAK